MKARSPWDACRRKIVRLGDPYAARDAVPKSYVDGVTTIPGGARFAYSIATSGYVSVSIEAGQWYSTTGASKSFGITFPKEPRMALTVITIPSGTTRIAVKIAHVYTTGFIAYAYTTNEIKLTSKLTVACNWFAVYGIDKTQV